MPTADPEEDELVIQLTRAVLAQRAPEELPILQATARAYFEQPDRARTGRKQKDEMLGFGVDALAMVTPSVLAVATPVVEYLLGEVSKDLKDESSGAIRRMVGRLFRSGRPDADHATAPVPGLTRDQLTEVRRLALEKANELRVPPEQAQMLADSMVGSLVLATA